MNATEELQMIDSYDKIDAVLERVNIPVLVSVLSGG